MTFNPSLLLVKLFKILKEIRTINLIIILNNNQTTIQIINQTINLILIINNNLIKIKLIHTHNLEE